MNRTSVDSYLSEGCGRCDKFQTPDCKVHRWTDELLALRAIMQESELTETMKWGAPCYTLDGKNVAMMAATNDYCSISFFKGVALEDPDGLLDKPGPNSRIMRLLRFESVERIERARDQAKAFIAQAVAVERSGVNVEPEGELEPMPEELSERLAAEADLRDAFDELTPGRQRSYIIYISGAKQSATREARVERSIPKIYEGKGFNER